LILIQKHLKRLKSLSEEFKTAFKDQEIPLRKYRLRLLTYDLKNLKDTVTLAKMYVFNTQILSADDIQEIYKHEYKPVIITDLLDISEL